MQKPTPLSPTSGRSSVVRRALVLGAATALIGGALTFAVFRPDLGAATTPSNGGNPAAPTTAPIAGEPAGGSGAVPAAPTAPAAPAEPGTGASGSPAGALGSGVQIGGSGGGSLPTTGIVGNTTGKSGPPTLVGPLDPSSTVEFALTLKMRDPAAIQAYLDGLYDPKSPNYRHFLTAAQFGERFGLPLQRIDALEQWATAQGFSVLGGFDQRTALRLSATAGQLTSVFGVHLANYVDAPTGIVFHAPLDGATMPPAITDAVAGLTGLDNQPAHPRSRVVDGVRPAAIPTDGLGPIELAKAYDIIPMYQSGLLGDGQTIAVISFDTFTKTDIDTYNQHFAIDGPPVERIAVGPPIKTPGDGTIEVALDIEVVHAVAPHAQILNFEAQNGSGTSQGDMVDAIVSDGRAQIVTDSWGVCDEPDFFGSGSRERTLNSLQAAAAAGISMFVASGDHGAFDCWSFDPTDHRVSVDFPSASPYTISVGGTALSVRTDGTYLSESGWEEYLTTSGTGGGLNPTEARPTWQVGPGVDNAKSDGKRQSPDVSAPASDESAYLIFVTNKGQTAGTWRHVGGTSAAAPFWAGTMLLVQQLAQAAGVGKLGFVDPMLYAIANSSATANAFHDVTRGGNLDYQATAGWDYATGLGSPDVTVLANAIVNYLAANPG
jgi:kumamolisin